MPKATDITKHFNISEKTLKQCCSAGIIASDDECSKEDLFRMLCARCLSEAGATVTQIKMILMAIHPSRQLNVGIFTPHDGMLTVFYVPHNDAAQRRHSLEEIWKIQRKSQVTVVINLEKIIDDIEAAFGPFKFKGAHGPA